MAQVLKSYLGLGGASTIPKTLPESLYTSPEMYELERRAIFSKKWLLLTHSSRIPNQGDWIRFDVANFQFLIAKDRKGNINSFHNACRHRAFPIVTEEKGNNSIFACKYHGWSYGLNGNLAKAPGYQDLPDFDKSKNGLFPVHVHVDKNGFVWVNLDGGERPEIAWTAEFNGADTQARFSAYNFEDYQFDHTWEMECDYNWKLLAEKYNESYHSNTKTSDVDSFYVQTKDSHIEQFGTPTPEQIAKGFKIASTYYFPNASMNISPHFFFMQRFVPVGATKTVVKYEVYRHKDASDEDFEVINGMYKRIMSEDKDLSAKSESEQGDLLFQKTMRELVQTHFRAEQRADAEIWPARQRLPKTATGTQKDLKFCAAVDCSKMNQEQLAF